MNVDALKRRILSARHQLVLLDRQGHLLSSCDSLMPLSHLAGQSILTHFQLLEGLEDDILGLQPGEPHLLLPMLTFGFEERTYRLTLEFWTEADVEGILWLLSTEDIPSEKLQQIQQDRNETYIGLEKVTEQEQTLREYTAKLELAHQSLQRFAYIISHDLKAPLRAISNLSTWVGEAIEQQQYEELPEYLSLLRSRVLRMENLIEGILQYHRAGKDRREPELVDLHELIEQLHAKLFAGRACTITFDPALPIMFCCRVAMTQIFTHLLSNVRRYACGDDCQVYIGYQEQLLHHRFAVKDNGPGIDPRHHERIFEVFQTLHSKDENEASGIGLSIVRRFTDEAGGKAWVESELGKGATFYFTWPKQIS